MNSLTDSAYFVVGSWPLLLDAAVKSTVVLLVAAGVLGAMRRSSAAHRHLTLSGVFGGLLVLPLLSWTLPTAPVLPPWLGLPRLSADATHAAPTAQDAAGRGGEVAPIRGASGNLSLAYVTPSTAPGSAASGTPAVDSRVASSNPATWTRPAWVLAIWMIGFVSALVPAIAGLISLRRLQRHSRIETSGPLWAALRQLSADLGLALPIRLLTSASRSMPMTWGLRQPLILLPAEAAGWSPDRQRMVLLHELAHIQRRDFASTLLVRFVCALYWFNPLVWLAARRLRLEQERACDDLVLRRGAGPEGYAEEVLRLAAGPTCPALEELGALAMARPSTLESRLLAILDRTCNRAAPSRLAILASALLAAAAVVPVAMLRAGENAATAAPLTASPTVAAAAVAKDGAAGPDRGLVAWWRADGDGKDSAGNHDGEFPFGIAYLPGHAGPAFDFRRSYAIQDLLARVSIPDSPDFELAESLTLEAWIHPLNFGGIVLFRGDDRPGFDTWQLDLLTPGKISFNFDDADNKSAELLAPIQLGRWQHVVATYHQGAMKLYVNGALAAESQTPLRPNTRLDPRSGPALGIGNTGGKQYNIPFDGLIDEVRIYRRALTATEVADRAKK
ncbi:MAG: hypothetical protein NTV51_16060 [Verrucomicrobia bacterium]|nr:hypothetical protein [Verrucomicrobiota bacterium]